jgi:nitroreductase
MKKLLILLAIMTNLSCSQAQQAASCNDENLLRLAEQRRSVRKYTSEPIGREILDKILTVAALAPSSYGQNPVEFVVVEGCEQLSKLADCKRIGAPSVRSAAAAVVVMADTLKGELWVEDASVAAGYLLLGAEQYGIGACWNQIHLRDGQRLSASDEIRRLLGIPDRYEVLCVVSLGHKDEQKSPRSGEQMKQGRIRFGKY